MFLKKKKIPKCITGDKEISSDDSDEKGSGEESSGENISNEESSDEKISNKEYRLLNIKKQLMYLKICYSYFNYHVKVS